MRGGTVLGDISCVIFGGHIGFVSRFLLLVDDDEPDIRKRCEDGASRAEDDIDLAAADALISVEAFAVRQSRVHHGDPFAESCRENRDGLPRQRDLGDEYDGSLAVRNRFFAKGKDDLRLSASRNAVKQCRFGLGRIHQRGKR